MATDQLPGLLHIEKIEAQLREEVQALLTKAEATDREALPDGLDLPTEVARREDRLRALAAAKAKIEERARRSKVPVTRTRST